MTNRVIVMVSDLDDASHGEINIMESPEHAARFVETLLESGFEQERVRVFGGDELQMQVHHRPVVNLVADSPRGQKAEAPKQDEQASAPEAQPEKVEVAASAKTPASAASRAMAALEEAAEPFVRNGVRFSSQFRPA